MSMLVSIRNDNVDVKPTLNLRYRGGMGLR